MNFIRLNSAKIPPTLRCLIPWAEKFGVSDDLLRENLLNDTPQEERLNLKTEVLELDDDLDLWLAGPEATGPTYSDEYIAFSAMRMVADSI